MDLATANALGDAQHQASLGTVMAAMALCLFNLCGVGSMARKRGMDVQAEMAYFSQAFIDAIGSVIERRYGAH